MSERPGPKRANAARRLRVLHALALCLVYSSTSSPLRAEPRTFAELQSGLDPAGASRQAALQTFAEDKRVAVKERIRAAAKLASDSRAPAMMRLDACLLEARLQGIAGSAKKRKKALAKARTFASKLGDRERARSIDDVMDADKALQKVEKSARGKKAAKLTKAQKAELKKGLAAFAAVNDEPQRAKAKLLALLLDEKSGAPPKKIAQAAGKLGSAGTSDRELADVRADAYRMRSRAFVTLRRPKEAAIASLHADYEAALSPNKAAFDGPSPHRRSSSTAELCRGARRAGLNCAEIEVKAFGARSFYDFSKSKQRRFDINQARDVFAEYESLLKDCIHHTEQLTELDSAVEFKWTVEPTGRIGKYEVRPRFLESGPFAECAADAFAQFRYPRFKGPAASVGYSVDIDLADATVQKGSR